MKNIVILILILTYLENSLAQVFKVYSEEEAQERLAELHEIFKQKQDKKIYFNGIYLLVTKELRKERIKSQYRHPECLEAMIVKFANMYIDALNKNKANHAPLPWKELFQFNGRPATHLLLGMNAHISYDLPLSLYNIKQREKSCSPENIKNDYFKLNEFFARITPLLDRELKKIHGVFENKEGPFEEIEKSLMITVIKLLRKDAWASFLDLTTTSTIEEYQKWERKIETTAQKRAILLKNMNPLIPPTGL